MARIDIVIPVFNEEDLIENTANTVYDWIEKHHEHQWRIVIANNASTDKTLEIVRKLEKKFPDKILVLDIDNKGRGLAQRTAWLSSDADVCVSMDADLSTDLSHLTEIVDSIVDGQTDIAFGSRKHPGSQTEYRLTRAIASWCYITILRFVMGLKVSDAQCGFKAISTKAAKEIAPFVYDNKGFFDSELLLIGQKNGYRLKEVPVRWIENRDSRYPTLPTTIEALRFLYRLRINGVPKIKRQK